MYRTAQEEEWDNQNALDFAKGKAMEEGLEKGREEERLKALTEKKEVAKNLKFKGIDIAMLVEATGFSIEYIDRL